MPEIVEDCLEAFQLVPQEGSLQGMVEQSVTFLGTADRGSPDGMEENLVQWDHITSQERISECNVDDVTVDLQSSSSWDCVWRW